MKYHNICLRFLIFASSLALYFSEAVEAFQVIPDQTKLPILSPSLKERQTKKIRLDNGMEILLISDPSAHLSGAMLSVHAGSWQDPIAHPGLAHFLEHMLFMGTKEFPEESEYQSFISEHGGQTNAFTTSSTTNYLFTVNNEAFESALKRFSSFFKEPLFNPSGVSRELNAIDQEYAKNLEQDSIRLIYLLKELMNESHPARQFNMGNSQSLEGVTRKNLENWYQTHYSANLMRLVLYSSLPIDQLLDITLRDFSKVPNKNLVTETVEQEAFLPETEGKYIYASPIKDTRTLTLVWELPSKFAEKTETQPEAIVGHILGHEGKKSLLAELKREKLAESLSAGGTKMGDNLTIFFLQIELTNQGLSEISQVVTRCFQAIKMLREKGVPQYIFDEVKRMATIQYQYQSKEDEFMMLMQHGFQIQDENFATYPEHTKIVQKFDPKDIADLIENLSPQKARIIVMAPPKLTTIKPDHREKWLGVEYAFKPIPNETVAKWKNIAVHPEIDLPEKNPFIPDDLRLYASGSEDNHELVPQPKLLIDEDFGKIYFAQDTKFQIPKIHWQFHIRTPQITEKSPSKIVLGDLFVKNAKEALNKMSYPASIAELKYEIQREKNGIVIEVNGYNQNAQKFLAEIFETIKTMTLSEDRYKVYKDSLLREYQNFSKESPLEQTIELFKSILYKNYVTAKEKGIALRKVNFKQFKEYVEEIFDKTYVEGMLYGNMSQPQAMEIVDLLKKTFNNEIYPKEDRQENAVIVLPEKNGPHFLESQTHSKGNAVLLAIENDRFSFKERAAQQILMQAIKQPFFSTLRTQQQTGYIVHSLDEEVERKLFNLFAVQSNTHDVRDLLARFEAFIESYVQELGTTELLEEQFETIKQALIQKLQEPAKNLETMGELLNTLAFKYDGDFRWINQRIDGFRQLSYSEFITMAKQFLGRDNKQRLAILMKGVIPDENEFSYSRARTWNAIRKASDYKERHKNG